MSLPKIRINGILLCLDAPTMRRRTAMWTILRLRQKLYALRYAK